MIIGPFGWIFVIHTVLERLRILRRAKLLAQSVDDGRAAKAARINGWIPIAMSASNRSGNSLTPTDPAYTASRQWIMAALVGVTFGVTLLTTYGIQASISQYSALAAIAIGAVGTLLLAPWKQTWRIAEDRRQLRALTTALNRAIRDGRPVPRRALCLDRDDELGDLSRAIVHLTEQSVQARLESRNLQRRMDDQIARSTTAATARLQREALSDPLTGLANRRHFEQHLADALDPHAESAGPLCLMLLDIDHFKTINDTLGHDVGDQCLIYLGRLLKAGVRRSDLAARLGGDEFVSVMRGQTTEQMRAAADRLARLYSQMPWGYRNVPRPTLSIGIAIINPAEQLGSDEALKRADEALYEVKRNGRAGVVVIHQRPPAA